MGTWAPPDSLLDFVWPAFVWPAFDLPVFDLQGAGWNCTNWLVANWLLASSLTMARLAGLLVPILQFGPVKLPWRITWIFCFLLSLLVTPSQLPQLARESFALSPQMNLEFWLVALGLEVATGLALGVTLAVFLWGVRLFGEWAAQLAGLNPVPLAGGDLGGSANAETPLGQLWFLIGVAWLLHTGGHRQILRAVLHSFASFPLGCWAGREDLFTSAVQLPGVALALVLQASLPVLSAALATIALVGLIERCVPGVPYLGVGLPLQLAAVLAACLLSWNHFATMAASGWSLMMEQPLGGC